MTTTHANGRAEHDYYRTPESASVPAFARLRRLMSPQTIMEPAAGNGALLGPLRDTWPEATIDAFDIASKHPAVVERAFWFDDTPQRYDLVVTNPPYSAAEAFVRYGMSRLAKGGRLALLLRLAFLASQERSGLFAISFPELVLVLPERPSFRGTGTDFSDYAWFVWREGRRARHGRIERL